MTNIIDKRDHGSLSEADLMPIKSDPEALFASNENIMQFSHFYSKGGKDTTDNLKIKIQLAIIEIEKQPETAYREAYIAGMKRVLNIVS